MAGHVVRTRRPREDRPAGPVLVEDPQVVSAYLKDAAHYPGGHARALAEPRTEHEICALLEGPDPVLPIGAQSSLTGGATPMGEIVLRLARCDRIIEIADNEVRVQAGVPLVKLQEALIAAERWYPPVPTFDGACVGGVIATNAAGASTYKYGSTRDWVQGLTVVLASGEVLDLRRGEVRAHPDGYFEIQGSTETTRVPVPTYRMPDVPKRSAGYHAAPGMDLIDLFIGSEGTLGVITEATLRTLPRRPDVCLIWLQVPQERLAVALVGALREASRVTWRTGDPRGLDVAAVEHLDRRCLALLREDGVDLRYHLSISPETDVGLLVQLELPRQEASDAARLYEQIAAALQPDAADTPLTKLCRMLDRFQLLDGSEMVLAQSVRRRSELLAVREAVPLAVNQRIGTSSRVIDRRIEKTAADMIVPYDRFEECLDMFRAAFEMNGLDYAIWGHISDANVHPNVIPQSFEDVRKGRKTILDCGMQVIRMGGCPLAEHGVGRSPVKQALLRALYGEHGIDQMRAVKTALDPSNKLAPGVIFPRGD